MANYIGHLNRSYQKDTFKRKYSYLSYNFGNILAKLKLKSKILEIGPGMGEFVKVLNDKKITNIDIIDNDKSVLQHIKKRYKINKSFWVNNITKQKLDKYDLVILVQVLEHVPIKDQLKLLKKLFSILNSNGYILIVVPNANNPLGIVERYGDLQHTIAFTSRSLEDLVSNSQIKGFESQIKGYNIPPTGVLNIVRILAQKVLHLIIFFALILNGGVFFKPLTPNMVLILRKN